MCGRIIWTETFVTALHQGYGVANPYPSQTSLAVTNNSQKEPRKYASSE